MLSAFIKFNKGLMKIPVQWYIWLILLVGTNLVIPFFLFDHLKARIVLGTMMLSMVLMTMITQSTGFTRLLGLGHISWFPMLYFF